VPSPLPEKRVPVAILGAGLTGLGAALALERAGVPHRGFEKLSVPGGHAVTLEEDGFRFDRTGHLLHLRDPELRREVVEWLGGDLREIARKSVIFSNGVYTRYPFQANTFGLPPDVAYECLTGFIEAHFAESKPEPRNFEEFCLVHFGRGITRHFMVPYNSRLWGVPPTEITSAWCQRFVPLPKLEEVIAGAVGVPKGELGYNSTFLYPRLGIGELPKAMHRRASHVELGRAPRSIDLKSRTLEFTGEKIGFDVLVSSVPLPVLVNLIADAPPPVRDAAARLRATHLHYLDMALESPPKTDFHWAYVPEAKYPFYRVGCYTHFSPDLAPPGKASLYVELADRSEPDLARVLPRVIEGLVEMGVVTGKEQIRFARERRIDFAYVIFDHAYYDALSVIEPFLAEARIVSAGRYGKWTYCSMEDAILMGREAAKTARALLGGG
jgi:protoporphyrinogen oxidase